MKIIPAQSILCNLAIQLRRLLWSCAGLLLVFTSAWAAPVDVPVRISFPDSLFNRQFLLIADWRAYLQGKLNRRVEIVSGQKISNSVGLLYLDKLDFAWVTDYPSSAHLKNGIRLVAMPLSKGQPYFTSYLIVPASDTKTSSLLQLHGAIFALSDPSKNGSYLEVQHQILMAGGDPARFFGKIIFTGSHRDVIKAVALGLAHAGEVDSRVWDTLDSAHPELAAQTRIVAKSREYGAPPIVVNDSVGPADYRAMQLVLLGMAADVKGIALLQRTGIDGFVVGDEKIYEHAIKVRQLLNGE